MYQIKCINGVTESYIYDPRVPEYAVIAPNWNPGLNKSGLLTFGVPDGHTNRDQILPLASDIVLYEDGTEIFRGRSITNEKDFYKTGKIVCEGELAFLFDSIYRPFSFAGTITDFLDLLITNHNAQVETRKQFTRGTVSVVDSNGNVARSSEKAMKTLDVIITRLVDTNGGYLRVRHDGAIRYLDYLADYGVEATQTIEFAKNLIDLDQFIDATKVRTVLIPYGAEIEGSGTGERLTIESVNGGLDYISNAGAVAAFGQIWETVYFDDVTVAANLKAKALVYLGELTATSLSLKLTAVDLAVLGVETRISIGEWVRVISVPHGLDSLFIATSLNIDLANPEKTKISFGNVTQSFTTINNQAKLDVSKAVDEISARILTATQLITGAVGGYVVFDPPEKPSRILIMDTPDKATAQNVWQWNVNGLGFSSTGIDGAYGTAITMDGSIVANFITVGKMLSHDGSTYFDLDNDEIKLETTIAGKVATVTLSPAKPFELAYDGLPLAYLSSTGVWVTSRYDINEDGVVDELDYKMIKDAILLTIPKTDRMDLNGDGLVNSTDIALWNYANRSSVMERRAGIVTLNDTTWTTVTFSPEMVYTPYVFLTPASENAGVLAAKVKDVSNTGFSAIIGGTATTSDFQYLAMS